MIDELKKYLIESDKIIFSYQCPYLALGKTLGFIDDNFVKNDPSNFHRLSLSKMLKFAGLYDYDLSMFIYDKIENGYTLKQISELL